MAIANVAGQKTVASGEHIRIFQLPKGINDTDLNKPIVKTRLINEVIKEIKKEFTNPKNESADLIVFFADRNNKVIPGSNKTSSFSQPQPSRIFNELTYSFSSPAQPWSKSDSLQLVKFANDFYPEIKRLMGNPFFNISVNVRKDSTISYGGLFFPSLNEMVLQHPSADIFCHESIHAFRDDYVMTLSTFEEGITRACEIEIFNRLPTYIHPFSENHSYPFDYYYESLNRPAIASMMGNILLNPSLQFMKYQLSSYIWAKPFLEDSSFLFRFNEGLYNRMLANPFVPPQEMELRTLFLATKPTVEGLPTPVWYNRQQLLNTVAPQGFNIFHKINEYSVNVFDRMSNGYEEPQVEVPVSWSLFNFSNSLVATGVQNSSSVGDAVLPVGANLTGYRGMITIIASATSNSITRRDTAIRAVFPSGERGIFGIVEGESGGIVNIRPLDTAMASINVVLINGSFECPEFETVKGRFRISFSYPNCQQSSKIITKDRSKYFVLINRNIKNYFTGAIDSLWNNAGNWSSGYIPNECSDVVIPAEQLRPCVVNNPAICRTLTVQPAAILRVRRSILVRL